jgi:hypothetical protein
MMMALMAVAAYLLPGSLQYKKGEEWVPVKNLQAYETAKDKYNTVTFEPVTTTALRMVIQLPDNYATGVHEWIVK